MLSLIAELNDLESLNLKSLFKYQRASSYRFRFKIIIKIWRSHNMFSQTKSCKTFIGDRRENLNGELSSNSQEILTSMPCRFLRELKLHFRVLKKVITFFSVTALIFSKTWILRTRKSFFKIFEEFEQNLFKKT